MNASKTRRIVCSTPECGTSLEVPEGYQVIHAAFPEDIQIIKFLLSGGANKALCHICHRLSFYPSAALCMIRPERYAISYIPREWIQETPSVVTETQQTLESVVAELGWRSKVTTEHESFMEQVSHEIARCIVPLVSSWEQAKSQGQEQMMLWFKNNTDSLGASFFAGLRLMADEVIRIQVLVISPKDPAKQSDLLKQVQKIRGVYMIIQSEERGVDWSEHCASLFQEMLKQLLVLSTLHLAQSILTKHDLANLVARVDELVIPGTLNPPIVSDIAESIRLFEGDSPSLLSYCMDAILAALCAAASLENPRRAQWTSHFVSYELGCRTGALRNQAADQVPLEFAARTADLEILWNFYSEFFNKKGPKSREVAAMTKLIDEMGLSKSFTEHSRRAFFVDLSKLSNEEVTEASDGLLRSALANSEMTQYISETWIKQLAARDLSLALSFARRIVAELVKAGGVTEALRVASRTCQTLNEHTAQGISLEFLEESRKVLRQAGHWPPSDVKAHVDFLNEEGNIYRILGRPDEALARYRTCQALLRELPREHEHVVNERNIAIVLRELGHVTESLQILRGLLPEADDVNKVQILNSIASSLGLIGERHAVVDTLRQALALLPKSRMYVRERINLLVSLASEMRIEGTADLPEIIQELFDLSDEVGDNWASMLATGMAAQIMEKLSPDKKETAIVRRDAIKVLRAAKAAPRSARPLSVLYLGILQMLADLLIDEGEYLEAIETLDSLLSDEHYRDQSQIWKLWVQRAICASKMGTAGAIRENLRMAMRGALEASARLDPGYDHFRLMADRQGLQTMLGKELLAAYRRQEASLAELRMLAEFQSSSLLTQRLVVLRGGDMSSVEVSDNELACFAELSDQKPSGIAVLQAIETPTRLHLLFTRVSNRDVNSELLDWEESITALQDLSDQVQFRLETWPATDPHDPLHGLSKWQEFKQKLAKCLFSKIPAGVPIVVVPGRLSDLPLQWVVDGQYPIRYLPSLRIGVLLSQEHRRITAGVPGWRPRSVHDFVVWRMGEREDAVAEFVRASDDLESVCRHLEISFCSVRGHSASRQAMLQAFENCECIRLSCHGRAAMTQSGPQLEFLVAHEDQLPPSVPAIWHSERYKNYVVDLEAFSSRITCPPVVFSAACASGRSFLYSGGEKIGFDRAFFRAGAISYIAPSGQCP